MSQLRVPVTTIKALVNHENADRLEIATVIGWQAVVEKGLRKEGEHVVYIPTDAILPPDLVVALGYEGKLSGPLKNRVKTVKLRGAVSQGLVVGLGKIYDYLTATRPDQELPLLLGDPDGLGMDVAELLGITKYEPPVPAQLSGQVVGAPPWMRKHYDIENIKNWPGVLVEGEQVVATEKIHGTNCRVGLHITDGLFVASRNRDRVLVESDTNLYWRAARQHELESRLEPVLKALGYEWVIVYGEVFGSGVQDLAYGHKNSNIEFRAFDLETPDGFMSIERMFRVLGNQDIPTVPVLYSGPFSEAKLAEITTGRDFTNSHVREGVVITPVEERQYEPLGRVKLKSISPKYLLRDNATEYH